MKWSGLCGITRAITLMMSFIMIEALVCVRDFVLILI